MYFIKKHKYFPVDLLNASPTAIGLTSGRLPGLDLFRAVELIPARNLETEVGALPGLKCVMGQYTSYWLGVKFEMLLGSYVYEVQPEARGMIASEVITDDELWG